MFIIWGNDNFSKISGKLERVCWPLSLRIDTEWPFRDRKSRFIVLLDGFSAITRKPLKVCREVKHCKKGFREIFQKGLTASYVCTWNFWENPLFCFVACGFLKVLDDFQKNYLTQFQLFCKDYTYPRVLSWTIPSQLPFF